ncbi:IclR family transcriptional regulator C-terminal domain-containing protein [Chelativorans composti]
MAPSETRDTPLERYISVLELLAPHSEGLTAPELERAMGLPRATMNRIIHVLLNSGLAAPSERRPRAIQLGPRILNLLHSASDGSWLQTLTRRPLQELADVTGQSAFLVRLLNDEISSVNCVAPDTTVRFYIAPGTPMPINASASAKAILAHQSDEQRDRILARELEAFTPRTLMDREKLLEELKAVRERGYAIEVGEHVFGLASVALPIVSPNGQVRYAVGLTGPEQRMLGEHFEKNLAALQAACEALTRLIALPNT